MACVAWLALAKVRAALRNRTMQQIKIFKGIESHLDGLEKEINQWLVENHVKVLNIFGNMAPQSPNMEDRGGGLTRSAYAPSDVLMVVVYEKQ